MIFHHRVNNLGDYPEINFPIELDLRTYHGEAVVSHDIVTKSGSRAIVDDLGKLKSAFIANIKESGIEDLVIEMFLRSGVDFYFLDSQIPDIIRLSRKYPILASRFIPRISDLESLNSKMMHTLRPKYVWADYSNFKPDMSLLNYKHFVTEVKSETDYFRTEPIFVSPELYSPDNEVLIESISETISGIFDYKRPAKYSVCTKQPHLYVESQEKNKKIFDDIRRC